MMKRWALPAAACAFLVVAMGAGTKIRDINPAGAGLTENADCDGMAMFHYNDHTGMTTINVVLHGFVPGQVYGIRVDSDGGGFSDPLAVEINSGGNGNFEISVPQDRTGHSRITVYLWDGDPDPNAIDTVTAAEIRASGTAS